MGKVIYFFYVIVSVIGGFVLKNFGYETELCWSVALFPIAWGAMMVCARWLLGIDEVLDELKKTKLLLLAGLLISTLAGMQGCGRANGEPLAPQSNIAYLQKIRDGVVFSEGFENDNFITAESWTVLQGVPANSGTQYIAGIKSWDNSANAQSLPVVSKTITATDVDYPGWMIQVWFYDTGDTTSPGPYIKLLLSNGDYISVGVRNSVSTTDYSYGPIGTSTDAPTTSLLTQGPRSVGWHSFVIGSGNGPAGSLFIQIDSNDIFHPGTAANGIVSQIFICADRIGGPGPSFGYFDELGYYKNQDINIEGTAGNTGLTLNVLNSQNVLLENFNGGLQNYQFNSLIFDPLEVFPAEVYLEMSQSNLFFRSNLIEINPGDIYQLVYCGFGRRVTQYKPQLAPLSSVNKSTAGVTETLFNAFLNSYQFGVQTIDGLANKEALDEWYNFAALGNPFAITVEDCFAAFGVLSVAPTSGNDTVTLMPNLSTNPTDAFAVGRQYLLMNNSNTYRQNVTLMSKTDTTLTFDSGIKYAFQAIDYVMDCMMFPFLQLGSNPNGLQMVDERIPRMNWLQTVEDYNGG